MTIQASDLPLPKSQVNLHCYLAHIVVAHAEPMVTVLIWRVHLGLIDNYSLEGRYSLKILLWIIHLTF